jgi:putative ABC transport system permease protein
LSSLLVRHLLHSVSQTISTLFVRVQVEGLVLSPWEILVSFAVTLSISIAAAFQPAREAMGVSPKEAMEIAQTGVRRRRSVEAGAWAAGCILACVPLSLMPGVAGVPLPGYLAILLLFVGFSLLAPWMLERVGRALSPVLRRFAGMPAYLAGRYLRDSGARTSISVGALITAVALFTALVIMIHSFRQTVELWVQQTVSGGPVVTTKMRSDQLFRFPIPEPIVAGLQQLDVDADRVQPALQMTYGDFPYEFEVMGMDTFLKYGGFVWMKGDPETARPLLLRGEGLLVSEVFANRTGLGVGDMFRTQIEGSHIEIPVAGIIRDYRTDGGVVFYSWKHFSQRFHDPQWSGVRFYFRDRAQDIDTQTARLRDTLIARWGDRLDLISGKELRNAVLKIFDETFAITTVLLLIALAVASLGITTTLTVLVLERTRQLNTLFAVGGSFGQIRSMICWEAGFLVVAEAIRACLRLHPVLHLVYVINRQSFGWTFSVHGLGHARAFVPADRADRPPAARCRRCVRRSGEPPATGLRER